eukprot:CAMPEP_0177770476 /NCGR_PEP_ID=MMETSP0491_2-20121128/10951_1 /TAXON_ID=63592 /ORGANISM="Tetraselmis chuii, Strain PLY429" /LENGTH=43 /DNA_ID= /DNA_START= /DNA_END= /DNA_ORIENTATION=
MEEALAPTLATAASVLAVAIVEGRCAKCGNSRSSGATKKVLLW